MRVALTSRDFTHCCDSYSWCVVCYFVYVIIMNLVLWCCELTELCCECSLRVDIFLLHYIDIKKTRFFKKGKFKVFKFKKFYLQMFQVSFYEIS